MGDVAAHMRQIENSASCPHTHKIYMLSVIDVNPAVVSGRVLKP